MISRLTQIRSMKYFPLCNTLMAYLLYLTYLKTSFPEELYQSLHFLVLKFNYFYLRTQNHYIYVIFLPSHMILHKRW